MKKSSPLLIALALLLICAGGKPLYEPKCFDPWINGMCYTIPSTIRAKTGRLKWGHYPEISETEGDTSAVYYNQSRTEILAFGFTPGGYSGHDDISWVNVFPNKYKFDPKIKTLPIRKFKSGKGIQLGMTKPAIQKILGESCGSIFIQNGQEILFYRANLSRFDACMFDKFERTLRAYNLYFYKAAYYFTDGKLSRWQLDNYP